MYPDFIKRIQNSNDSSRTGQNVSVAPWDVDKFSSSQLVPAPPAPDRVHLHTPDSLTCSATLSPAAFIFYLISGEKASRCFSV